ncbi:MAG: glycosyltransferase family 9 protein [Cytophagales bacterium]|nr:MAG: glycosyltransferase family 9 protein [Cytophagales bacterium]
MSSSTAAANVLIYRLGSLGDTVIALPCFHKIREHYPNATITLLTNRPVAHKAAPIEAVLGEGYFFDQILAYPIGTRNPFLIVEIIRKIRSLSITTVINITAARSLMSIERDKWFFRAAGVRELIGFPDKPEDVTLFCEPSTGEFEWEAKRLARRLAPIGMPDLTNDSNWNLRLTLSEYSQADNFLRGVAGNTPLLAISAGTKMQAKDWGESNWQALIKKLGAYLPDWTLVMLGASDERDLSERCLQCWPGTSINLCGQPSPRVSAVVLQKARLFVGHDSGPMHLAACVGTPCVAIFSARNLPRQWYPRGDSNKILYTPTDCAGCGLEVCIKEKKKCISSISVDQVFQSIVSILGGKMNETKSSV